MSDVLKAVHDIVILGATSRLGRLVVSYLATHCSEEQRLLVVDNDRQALLLMRAELGEWGRKLSIDVTDVTDAASLESQLPAGTVAVSALISDADNEVVLQCCAKRGIGFVGFGAPHRPEFCQLVGQQAAASAAQLLSFRLSPGMQTPDGEQQIAMAKVMAETALYLSRGDTEPLPATLNTTVDPGSKLCRRLQKAGVSASFIADISEH